ncbi:unnamed protein product [Arctogadus glacialis]
MCSDEAASLLHPPAADRALLRPLEKHRRRAGVRETSLSPRAAGRVLETRNLSVDFSLSWVVQLSGSLLLNRTDLRMSRYERRDSLPGVQYAVRRRFSGQLLLPPVSRRHSSADHQQSRLLAHQNQYNQYNQQNLPLAKLEALYNQALAERDDPRSV